MSIGWAVIGTGSHVTNHMAPAIAQAADTRLAAVCSREMSRAQVVAERFGFSRAYDSYDALLRDEDVDVVYICTPNVLHAEQTILAARAGKHVLVEKPMALRRADAEAMVAACERAHVRLGVGFHLRHHPAHKEARRLISEGRIGAAFLFETRWVVAAPQRTGWWQDADMIGAYVLMARGVHQVDLVHYLSNLETQSVMMMTDGQRSERPLEDTAVATLRLGEDIFATLVATRNAACAQNSFTVYGTKGTIQALDTIGPHATGTLRLTTAESDTEITFHAKAPYQEEVESFNRSVSEESIPNASGIDGLRVVQITEALLESARSGQAIVVST